MAKIQLSRANAYWFGESDAVAGFDGFLRDSHFN